MAYFDRNKRSGGGRSNFGGNRSFDKPTLHKATCSNCGKECEVPFRPTGSKPVYCRDCFAQNGGPDSRRSEENNFPRSSSGDRRMYDATCDNCQKNCKIPFQPTAGRPIFCSNCFETNGQNSRRSGANPSANSRQGNQTERPNYKEQFEMLNAKMDKILSLLTPSTPKADKPPTTKAAAEAKEEKAVEPKEEEEKKPKVKKKTTSSTKKPSTKKK